jgi:hypothetical protein
MANKTYEVDVGGKTYEVDAPDANTAWVWANQYSINPLDQSSASSEKKPKAKTSLVPDVVGSLIAGGGQLAELPGQLYGLATGDFDTPASRFTKGITEFGQGLKSEGLREKEEGAQQRIGEAGEKGFLSGLAAGAKEYLTDPALLFSGAVQTLPSMVGSLGAGTLANLGTREAVKAVTKKAATEAVEAAARRAGVAGGVGFSATQQGAGVGEETFTQALNAPQEVWNKNPEFRQRVQGGETVDDVKADMALRAGRQAAAAAAAVSGVTAGLLPNTLEKAILGKGVSGNIASRALKSAGTEAIQEGSEEGGGRLAQNLAISGIDPEQDLLEGVGGQIGTGAVLGGILGGGAGAASPRPTVEINTEGPIGAPMAPPPGAPAPDTPAIRTIVIEAPAPDGTVAPVSLDIISEPDVDGNVFVRRPDGVVIQAPVSAIDPEFEPTPAVEPEPVAAVEAEPAVAVVPAPEAEPVAVAAPEPTPVTTPAPAASTPKMPTGLSRATPSFNYGPNRFNLAFDNDVDKAVYIATSKTPSKARPKYLEWLGSQGISDPAEIEAIGTRIRADIKSNVQGGARPTEPMRLPSYASPSIDVTEAVPAAPVTKIPEVEVPELTPEPAGVQAAPLPDTMPVAPAPEVATPEPMAFEPDVAAAPEVEAAVEVAPEAEPESEPQVFTPEIARELDTYDPKLSKELVGKTVAGAMRHVANRSKSDLYKSLGNRVADMVDVLQNNGMKFTFSVAGERGGIDPEAKNSVKLNLARPGIGGVSTTSGATNAGYDKVDVAIRGKPLPKAQNIGASEQTVIHEGIHGVTQALISLGRRGLLPAGSRSAKAVQELNDLYVIVINALPEIYRRRALLNRDRDYSDVSDVAARLLKTTNAFKDVNELVAWGLTNYDMQTVLKAIPVEGGNAFTKFVRTIGKMLGLGEKDYNALRRLIEISEDLIPADAAAQTEIAKAVVAKTAQASAAATPSEPETVVSEQRRQPPPPQTPPAQPQPQPAPNAQVVLKRESRWDEFRRKMVDRLRRLRYTEEQIERAIGTEIPRSQRPSEKAALLEGRAAPRLNALKTDYVDKIIKTMIDLGLNEKDVDRYLLARAAPWRNAKIAARNPKIPDGGSGYTDAKAKQVLSGFLVNGKLASLDKVGKLVDELVEKNLKTYVEYDLMSQSQADALRASEPFYVPLKGVAEASDMSVWGDEETMMPSTGRGFSVTPKEAKVAKGRYDLPFSPLANLFSDSGAVILRGERNRVGKSFLNDIALKYPSSEWQVFTEDNPDMTQVLDSRTGKLKDVPVQMGMQRDTYFVVKEDGRPIYIKISDPLLMRAMINGSAKELSAFNNFLNKTIGVATKAISRFHTTLNPEFFVTNAFRDVQAAVFNILAEETRFDGRLVGESILKGTMKDITDPVNFKNLFKATYNHAASTAQQRAMNNLLQDAKDDGALTGWVVNENPEDQMVKIKTALDKASAKGKKKLWYETVDGLTSVLNAVEDFNSVFENTTRLAVYKNARAALEQKYLSANVPPAEALAMAREEAASMARNVTVDFNRKGELGPTFNALFAFWNAAIQGNVQLLRSLMQNPRQHGLSAAQKLTIGIIGLGALQAIMGAGMSDDDEDGKSFYEKIPDYEKSRNLIIMNPNGKDYIKIPLPYGYSFFHNMGANGAELLSGQIDAGKFATSMITGLLGNFSPMSTGGGSLAGVAGNVFPTVLKPFYDLAINENFFGSSIYNKPFDENQSKSSVARYSTPEGYKAVASWLNSVTGGVGKVPGSVDVSPEAIQYLVNQSVGGAGKVGFDLIDLGKKQVTGQDFDVSDVPLLRRVLGEPNKNADLGEYYDRVAKMAPIQSQLKSSKGEERAAIREKYPVETNPAVVAARTQAQSRLRNINERKKRIYSGNLGYSEKQDELDRLNELQRSAYIRFNTVYNRVDKEERGR